MFKIGLYIQIIVKNKTIMFNLYYLMYYLKKKKIYKEVFRQLRTIYACVAENIIISLRYDRQSFSEGVFNEQTAT